MATTQFTNLVIVAAVAFAARLVLGLARGYGSRRSCSRSSPGSRSARPAWEVQIDAPVQIFSLVGLAFLMCVSGFEIDVERLRGPVLRLTTLGFVASLAVGLVVGLAFDQAGIVCSPLFVAIVLSTTSLGVVVPVVKDSGNIG
ncbi:MAG: cation:proton antiporter [Solirubrobacteraceae bacterium]|jgi:Kef-type K+ transport system membrane component KefB